FRKHADLDFRGAAIWGLASGVGFGVAEGVMYSSDFYNGVSGAETYVMRFVSCVGLHAVWSAAVAIEVHAHPKESQGIRRWPEYAAALLRVAWIPMILHGLYDTLLKKDLNLVALAVAVASFAWLVVQIERARKRATLPVEAGDMSSAARPFSPTV